MNEIMAVNGKEYKIIKLLGHGKGGYSYLAEKDGNQYVLKQIHHEPCSYYNFGNKIEAEQNDYRCLVTAGIRVPKMIDIDVRNERIVKEYIEGETIYKLVKDDRMNECFVEQVREMQRLIKDAGLNIDYFPTNFVVKDGKIYYVDYECSSYSEKWNFENWGIRYWSKTPEFIAYDNSH